MKIPKSSDTEKEQFRALVPDAPGVEVKAMFGNLAGFVNGNMFMGLFGPDIGLRLPGAEREALLSGDGHPFGPADRPMKEYVVAPTSWSTDELNGGIARALIHVSTFPPKQPKKRAQKA